MIENRKFCIQCGAKIKKKKADGIERDYCPECDIIFYDNPLPVVSSVVVNEDREVLLVLRDREPEAGKWCLPSGFVETGESIEDAVLRELSEETGVIGKVVRLLDTVSLRNKIYGDLIWVSFEVKYMGGKIIAGDDAREAQYFPIQELPGLAFQSNVRAVANYLEYYRDIWKMNDSFFQLEGRHSLDVGSPSDSLYDTISKDARIITENWIADVRSHPTTRSYGEFNRQEIYERAHRVIEQFGEWMTSTAGNREQIWSYYRSVGEDRKKENFQLSEVLSALSLTRKHIFAHVFSKGGIWVKPLDMYIIMEFMSRVNLFFDKANHHITVGYENAS